ncbi:MAG TPA: ATP-binding cassette domain-containing protein, partial [Polyangia bacterium]
MPLLEVSHLSKDFGGLRAVSDLTFSLEEGEILGLIGPNGAGKTTAFNLMSGFIAPSGGTVRLNGHDLVGLSPNAIVKRGIARTFQVVKP